MLGLDQWRWAARLIREALLPLAGEAALPTASDGEDAINAGSLTRDHVASLYRARLEQLERDRSQITLRRARCLRYTFALGFALAILLGLSIVSYLFPVWSVALPLVPMILLIVEAQRGGRCTREITTLVDFYRRRLERVRHEWMGKGDSGSDLEMPDHLSARDFDLFGDGSVFELLCDVETPAGRETLAKWLQCPASTEEVTSRQQSVRSLRDRSKLREELALLREGGVSEYSWKQLREWLAAEPVVLPRWVPWVGLILSLSIGITGICWWQGSFQASSVLWVIGGIAVAEASLALLLRSRVKSILEGLLLPIRKVESLRWLCARVQEEQFEGSQLVELRRRLKGSSERIASLQRLVRFLDLRNNEWLVWPFVLLLGTTQVAIQIERWRQRHGHKLIKWITALG